MKNPQPNLLTVLDTIEIIRNNTPDDKDVFMSDINVKDATLMRLQDIGEQLARLRDNFPKYFDSNQTDEWHKIIGLRNIISHGYREIDFEIIWDILANRLNDFASSIQQLTVNK